MKLFTPSDQPPLSINVRERNVKFKEENANTRETQKENGFTDLVWLKAFLEVGKHR